MEFPEKIGIYTVIAIILTMFLLLHVEIDKDIIHLVIGISLPFLIPYIYDKIKQSRKKKNIREFIRKHLDALRLIDKKDKDAIYMIEAIVKDLHNIEPYIQDAYPEISYTEYLRKISYLQNFENPNPEDYYNLTIDKLEDLVRAY